MTVQRVRRPACSFDRIARVYRTLEYASFGRALERTRETYLGELGSARHALVLGDGDGRFLGALLQANREVRAVVLDSSRRMLDLLTERCGAEGQRVTTQQVNLSVDVGEVLTSAGQGESFDLVVTHYFLDCLSQPELETLVRSVRPQLCSSARWVISEFRTPPRGISRVIGRILIRSLYLAFRLLTGLHVRHLPDYATALTGAGFVLEARRLRLWGLLVADLWRLVDVPTGATQAGDAPRPARRHADPPAAILRGAAVDAALGGV